MTSEFSQSTMTTLEFHLILEKASREALSEPGQQFVLQSKKIKQPDLLKEVLSRVSQMRDCLLYEEVFPLEAFPELSPSFKRLDAGAPLQADEFMSILGLLESARKIRHFIESLKEKYPGLFLIVKMISALPGLEKEIQSVFHPTGDVKDNASSELARIRRSIGSNINKSKSRLQNLLQQMVKQGMAQDETLALRNGRLTIPVKENFRGKLNGVIVDQSASGSTVYMEPFDVLEMSSELRRLYHEESQEIQRILIQLSAKLTQELDSIQTNYHRLIDIDVLYAKARYSISMDGHAAEIVSDAGLILKHARHPLLLQKLGKEKVVPLQLEMKDPLKTIIITGPNAGGKTVALKTVGLLALMHHNGFHIPAQPDSQFPFLKSIFADIGDKQSIDLDLSTFSSHISNMKEILDQADHNTLILLDEIGGATDPAEGAALAMSILSSLTKRKSFTIATTHIGQLKIFANEEEAIENGSMTFDQKTLSPTYHFQLGLPGSSYAFEIASRLGIDETVIQKARNLLGEDRGRLDELILFLENEKQQLKKLRSTAEIDQSKLSALIKLYDDKNKQLRDKEKSLNQEHRAAFEQMLKDANAQIEQVVRELRETQADKKTIRKAKDVLAKQKKRVQKICVAEEPDISHVLKKDDWVKWPGQSGKGQIISEPDKSGRVLVNWDHMKMKIPVEQLSFANPPEMQKGQSKMVRVKRSSSVTDELDLRGYMVDEALDLVDQYLGNANMTGFKYVRIIHGKGTGALRKAVTEFLKTHHLVKSKRFGNWNEGDTGVTIVEIK